MSLFSWTVRNRFGQECTGVTAGNMVEQMNREHPERGPWAFVSKTPWNPDRATLVDATEIRANSPLTMKHIRSLHETTGHTDGSTVGRLQCPSCGAYAFGVIILPDESAVVLECPACDGSGVRIAIAEDVAPVTKAGE